MLENHQDLIKTLTNEFHVPPEEQPVRVSDSRHSLLFEILTQIHGKGIEVKAEGNYFYTHWMPTDTPGLYEKNLNDDAARAWLEQLGWINRSITYRINRFGFRCADFSEAGVRHRGIVVLGCSYTQGTGLLEEQTYCAHLENHFKIKTWNLSVPGVDTKPLVNFALCHMLQYIDPIAIIFTVPPVGRYRQLQDLSPGEKNSHPELVNVRMPKMYKPVDGIDLTESAMNYTRDTMALKALAGDLGVPFVANTANTLSDIHDPVTASELAYDRARDLMHFGPVHHRRWADKLIDELEHQLR